MIPGTHNDQAFPLMSEYPPTLTFAEILPLPLPLKAFHPASLLRGLSSLLGLVAAELGLGLGLDGTLGLADGRDALDSGLTEVGAVAVLGGLVGDRLVGPATHGHRHIISLAPSTFCGNGHRAGKKEDGFFFFKKKTHLRLDLAPLCSDLRKASLGLVGAEGFLVMTVKPLSLRTMPMAYVNHGWFNKTVFTFVRSWCSQGHVCTLSLTKPACCEPQKLAKVPLRQITDFSRPSESHLAGVLVDQVQGVARELDAAILPGLREEAVVVTYSEETLSR